MNRQSSRTPSAEPDADVDVDVDVDPGPGVEQAKRDFIGLVSHELRTPLTGIRGYTDLLVTERAGPLNANQRRMLEVIDICAQRLQGSVEDLLVLSAVDAGLFGLVREPAHLRSVVDQVLARTHPLAAGAQVEMAVHISPTVPEVFVDDRHLKRALTNLVENAIKFSHPGATVRVHATEGGDEVRISVVDEGIGIPDAEQPDLFTRFFRGATAREREVEGVGLGLAVVKAIVERHEGTIEVTSAPGEGTTFTVRLPLRRTQ